jgi:peroxiredoxin
LEELLTKAKEEQEAAGEKAEKAARDKKEPDDKVAKAKKDAMDALTSKLRPIESTLNELKGHLALADGDNTAAWEHFNKADNISKEALSRLRLQTEDKAQAEQLAKQAVDSGKNQVYPLANYAYILYKLGKPSDAGKVFEQLRKLAPRADLDAPVFVRLQPLVKELNLPDDWRDTTTPDDVGIRPDLNSLGPYTWQPSPAPSWQLPGPDGKVVSLSQYRGKPVVVIFYLGFGCVHCVEQLKAFGPMTKEFADAGISLVAISTDDVPTLEKSLQKAATDSEFPFPLVSDSGLEAFKSYRSYDDFEKSPLHATFLIDGEGLVRWQDISFEPFADAKFVLGEAKRLLNN